MRMLGEQRPDKVAVIKPVTCLPQCAEEEEEESTIVAASLADQTASSYPELAASTIPTAPSTCLDMSTTFSCHMKDRRVPQQAARLTRPTL